jgi:hypothetical protein
VVLELFVRVTPRWRNTARLLAEMGYETRADERRRARVPRAQPRRRQPR